MYQLQILHCSQEKIEEASDLLMDLDAFSVTLTDGQDHPILEPPLGTMPLWPRVVIEALFVEEKMAVLAMAKMECTYPKVQCTLEKLIEKDWVAIWKQEAKPLFFGETLCICPTHLTSPSSKAKTVWLDPGLAFGTGTHPTTGLCLHWLAKAHLAEKSVLDYGCGSGILALAAIKLGALHAYAVDIDPQALQATLSNAEKNTLGEESLTLLSPEEMQQEVDIVLANILLNPLLHLQPRFFHLLRKPGTLVLSGILQEQVPALLEVYTPLYSQTEVQYQEGWALVEMQK